MKPVEKFKGKIGEQILIASLILSAIVTGVGIIGFAVEGYIWILCPFGFFLGILTLIMLEIYNLLQAIEYNTRKKE